MDVAVRRIVAWCIDWCCILVWVAVTLAVGVPLFLAGIIVTTNMVVLNLVGAIMVIVPVVLDVAWCESRLVAATPGKRAMGLIVYSSSTQMPYRLALLRNILKLGMPWLIGHAAVFAIVSSSHSSNLVPTGVWVLTGLAYLMPIIWIISLFVGDQRTPYDRICGTTVLRQKLTTAH
ncbi:hypothetical protein AC792_09705 [Arthrobacter sp. RIT-PI-e]|uniref:RDD family protein n=1 Tax=Arthrobacter sp. RIT-PI-e TaxID=1681197 RepID=UPI0006A25879|nr:RDD family protein [Arthrobacter sp. RIT-PI-e]KNC18856.1 hypothetical protein AC792_09705 [Arthrobacter sp. RIT-PI-e]